MIDPNVAKLAELIEGSRRLVVLTGAGCSTESGIPDYRGANGTWERRQPMNYAEFLRSAASRRYFWARNFRGWPSFSSASPNAAHEALAAMERIGRIASLITQNVDRLHQAAGSESVIELHGTTHEVVCIDCRQITPRTVFQELLTHINGAPEELPLVLNPDGDAELTREATDGFILPDCSDCGGILKPNVVFFGDSVARPIVDRAMGEVDAADLLLVVGSSLTVWSGYRFARRAAERQIPIAILNLGVTRADDLALLKIEAACGELLPSIVRHLQQERI
jgi:NAD+-dependent protein deacetylase sirtuin 4